MVAFSIVSALLLLPVLLRLVVRAWHAGRGARGARSGRTASGEDRWDRLTRRVMARPIAFLVVGPRLLALAVPTAGLTTFTPDV